MPKYVSRPHSNSCHFCDKVYTANTEKIYEAGKLFEVPDFLVGKSWWNFIVACPACIKKEGEKIKKQIDEMIAEAESLKTNKRVKRWYPKRERKK